VGLVSSTGGGGVVREGHPWLFGPLAAVTPSGQHLNTVTKQITSRGGTADGVAGSVAAVAVVGGCKQSGCCSSSLVPGRSTPESTSTHQHCVFPVPGNV